MKKGTNKISIVIVIVVIIVLGSKLYRYLEKRNLSYEIKKVENYGNARALNMAKHSEEVYIKGILSHAKGNLKVIGWKTKRINHDTYVVSYTYEINQKRYSLDFEVNTTADTVRDIRKDPILMKKYAIGTK